MLLRDGTLRVGPEGAAISDPVVADVIELPPLPPLPDTVDAADRQVLLVRASLDGVL